ncbi:MAG: serine/threonine-protein kinase [Planctomycetota bacterium]
MTPDPLRPEDVDSELDAQFLAELRAAHTARQGQAGAEAVTPPEGYRIVRPLRRGGQGAVFVAEHERTGRQVALKVMLRGLADDSRARRRFEREAELVASLRHPNIVTVFDSGLTRDGRPFTVMELVDGEDLATWSAPRRRQPSGVATTLDLFLPIAAAVEHAHRHGIVHRDLKPSNVVVDRQGIPRVVDFGIAKSTGNGRAEAGAALTVTGEFVGSLAWAAPEQLDDRADGVDARTDVYALGLLLYHLLTEAHPYQVTGSLSEVVNSILSTPAAPPREQCEHLRGHRDLEAILMKALAKDPADRYATVGALEADLRRMLNGLPVTARDRAAGYVLRRWVGRHRVASVALLAAAVFGPVYAWRLGESNAILARQRSATIVAQARQLLHTERVVEAEEAFWRELLDPPAGAAKPELSALPHAAAHWGLRELYREHPCAVTVNRTRYTHIEPSPDGRLVAATADEPFVDLLAVPSLRRAQRLPSRGELIRPGAFSPNSKSYAAIDTNARVLLWDLDAGGNARVLGTAEGGSAARFLCFYDANTVWTAHSGSRVKSWTLDGRQAGEVIYDGGEPGRATAVAADRSLLAVSTKHTHTTKLVVMKDRHVAATVKGMGATFCRDGRHLITRNGVFLLRPPGTDRIDPLQIRPPPYALVLGIATHPSDDTNAWGALGGLHVYADLTASPDSRELHGHTVPPRVQAFVPSRRRRLVSVDQSGAMKLWELEDASVETLPAVTGTVHEWAFDRGSAILVGANTHGWGQPSQHRVIVWDVATRTVKAEFGGHEHAVYSVDIHPARPELVASCDGRGRVFVTNWRLGPTAATPAIDVGREPAHPLYASRGPGQVNCVRFGPDGRLAVCSRGRISVFREHERGHWSLDSGPHAHPQYEGRLSAIAWSPDGGLIGAAQAKAPYGVIWLDLPSGRVWATGHGHRAPVRAIAADPNGGRFATVSDDRRVALWAAGGERPTAFLSGHQKEVFSVAWFPAGSVVASGDTSGVVKLWDADSLGELYELGCETGVFSLAIAPDGATLAIGRPNADPGVLLRDLTGQDPFIAGNLMAWLHRLGTEHTPAAHELRVWARAVLRDR